MLCVAMPTLNSRSGCIGLHHVVKFHFLSAIICDCAMHQNIGNMLVNGLIVTNSYCIVIVAMQIRCA